MLENQFSQFGEIRLQFPIVYKVLSLFLYLLAVHMCTSVCARDRGAAGGGAGAIPLLFAADAVSFGVPIPQGYQILQIYENSN